MSIDDRSNALKEASGDFLRSGSRAIPFDEIKLAVLAALPGGSFLFKSQTAWSSTHLRTLQTPFFSFVPWTETRWLRRASLVGVKLLSLLMVQAILASAIAFLRPR